LPHGRDRTRGTGLENRRYPALFGR